MGRKLIAFAVAFLGFPMLAGLVLSGGPTVLAMHSQSVTVGGTVKSVSADGKEITLSIGSGGAAKEERIRLTARTEITLDDKSSKPADIAPGMRLTISYDKNSKEAVAIKGGGGDKKADALLPPKPGDEGEASELFVKCQRLCEDLTKAYKGKDSGGKATIAVVEFSDLSGGVTDFGRLLSEELITKLFATGNYKKVVERLLLNKAIADHKLQLQGLVDPKSAKELGKILGVDAIVSGTVADLGDSLRVNARLISTETGEVFAVAAATIVKDEAIIAVINGGGRPTRSGPDGSSSPSRDKTQPVRLPFREDFSGYKQDDRTAYGKDAKVRVGEDGRNWLMPSAEGQHPIALDVELPVNFYIEFDYRPQSLERPKKGDTILSGIILEDETGARLRIEWTIEFTTIGGNRMTLPGGKPSAVGQNFGFPVPGAREVGTIRIVKKGDQFEVKEDKGFQPLVGNVSDFKKFTRLEIDLYKGSKTMLSITNIKVGSLDASETKKKK